MYKIYVDESGNLGPQGRFFVIGTFCTADGKRIRNILKRHCAKHGLDEFKNRSATFTDRQDIINKIRQSEDHEVAYICVDKHNIQNKKLLEDNNLLFNYTFGFLMKELVSRHHGDDLRVTIDNRNQKVMSINSLGDYVRIKAITSWGYSNNMDFHYCDSKDDRLVQAADLVAGTVLERYKLGKEHLYSRLSPAVSLRFPYEHFGK